MKHETLSQSFAFLMQADVPTFIWGAPGVGKSDAVYAAAADAGREVVEERLSQLESVDLRGVPVAEGQNVIWAVPTMFQKLHALAAQGKKTLLFLDEANQAPPSVQSAAYQLVLNRRIGDHVLPDTCAIVAAGNRLSDKASAQRMPSALANRLAHLDLEADADSWRIWASQAGLDPMLIAFVAFRPELLHKMPDSDARAFPTPRSWAQVSKICAAPDSLRPALVRSLVGEGAAGEFEAFVRVFRRLPRIDELLAAPLTAPVPDEREPALLYAICSALARKATRENFGAVIAYAERLPRDFTVLLTTDAIRRDRALSETRAYVDFVTRNGGAI